MPQSQDAFNGTKIKKRSTVIFEIQTCRWSTPTVCNEINTIAHLRIQGLLQFLEGFLSAYTAHGNQQIYANENDLQQEMS